MIMVSGYYGFDNLGDDAILDALCSDLVTLGVKHKDILVLSNQPDKTEAQYQVTALPRYDLKQIWSHLGSSKLFISGGGSLLQDVTSKRSIPYYLGLVELALLRRVPVVMYGQGLGPVQSRLFRSWVGRSFKKSLACSVRDEASQQFLVHQGVAREKIALCADPVFQKELVGAGSLDSSKILLNLRPYEAWEGQIQMWLEHLNLWQSQGFSIEFIPFGPGDAAMGRLLQDGFRELRVHSDLALDNLGNVFSGASLCISMRLHGLIFSALHDCLPLGLNYDPKVEAICKQLAIPFWEIEELGDLGLGLGQVRKRAKEHRQEYQGTLQKLHQGALQNRIMLAQVLR